MYPSKLKELTSMSVEYGTFVQVVSERVLRDPKFATWSGSGKQHQHHYGTGGLQHHTWEVVTLCRDIARSFGPAYYDLKTNARELFLAALFHDIGKTEDYQQDSNLVWEKAPHSRDIHHISRSALIYNEAALNYRRAYAVDPDKAFDDRVLHCILSHHGMREWGSPVMPHSRIAWLLHLADSVSARMNDADKWDFTK